MSLYRNHLAKYDIMFYLSFNLLKLYMQHVPDTSMSETWSSLSKAVREIHNHNASNLSFEENYRFAYNLVLHKQGDLLYRGVNDLITENINKLAEEKVKPCFPTTVSGDPAQKGQEVERFLRAVRDSWDDHIGSMSKLRDILKYMVCFLVNIKLAYADGIRAIRTVCIPQVQMCQ